MSTVTGPAWRRWAGVALIIVTLAWTIRLLAMGWGEADFGDLSPSWLFSIAAFVLVAASIALAFPAFWWLVRLSGAPAPPFRELMRLHFVSQLMRHLPGRFVGVAYQVTVARHVASASQWVAVNATYIAMALWFAAVLPVLLLLLVGRLPLGVGFLALLGLVVGPLVVLRWMQVSGIRARPTGLLGKLAGVLVAVADSIRSKGFGKAMAWYAASWIVYGLAWSVFGTSLPGVGAMDGLVLCALYSLAWALGFVVIVTPSGLGVRELAFAALAHDFPPEVIAYTAMVVRLGLLCADLLLGLLSLWIGRWRHA